MVTVNTNLLFNQHQAKHLSSIDPFARASLVGLTASHTRAHVIRALLEGVAFSLRDSLEIFKEIKIPIETIRLGGGGARSPL